MHRRIAPVFLIALTALFLGPAAASAQEGEGRHGRGGPSPERMLERMEQRLEQMKGPLNITDAQERRIRQALRRGATQARRVLEQHPDRSPERHEAMRRVRWDTEDRVHAVLNCAQRDQLRRVRREHRAERREHRRERRGQRRQRRGSRPDGGI